MSKTLPHYHGDVEKYNESILFQLMRVFRKLWGPFFAIALMVNMTILYIKVNPPRANSYRTTCIPPATPPKPLPFTQLGVNVGITQGGVPMLIHQSWKNNEVPSRFKRWQQQWSTLHPEWNYHLWTDEDNRELVKQHYPWFLNTFDAFPMGIMRADSVRYLYMYHYGGVYADLDMEPLKTTESLLQTMNLNQTKNNAILAYMGNSYKFQHNVPNAWMVSTPHHPFWLFCLTKMIELAALGIDTAEDLTGPVMLYKAMKEYNEAMRRITGKTEPGVEMGATNIFELQVLKPGLIYPYDWDSMNSLNDICWAKEATLDEQKCKSMFPDAYTITYWSHSWE